MSDTPKRHVVGRASELGVGERMLVEVGGRSIGIFNVDGEYFGIANRCPHKGAELCRGHVVGALTSSVPGEISYDTSVTLLMCPWHGWEFDVTTGLSYFDPKGVRARRYLIDVEVGHEVVDEIEAGEADFTPGEYALIHQESFSLVEDQAVPGRRRGPYTAETIPVLVEDDYLVVDVRPRPQPTTTTSEESE